MQASELNKILVDELRDIYSAETQLGGSNPRQANPCRKVRQYGFAATVTLEISDRLLTPKVA